MYRRFIGLLLYLNLTGPDITYAIQQLSQSVNAPRQDHWEDATHGLRYLKHCPSKELYFSSENYFKLVAYFD